MRIMTIAFWVLLLATAAQGGDPNSPADESGEKLGYAIGHQVGNDFRRDGMGLDADAVVAGVRDAIQGATPRWTAREMRDALRQLEESRRSRSEATP